MPEGQLTTLSEVAKGFLPPALVTFFIVGGPLCGVLTSMVPVIMMTCSQIQAAAETGLFPAVAAKKNKHGISPVVLVFVMLFAIVITSTGATFGVLMTLFSFANCLGDIVLCIIPFFLCKKYPHAYRHAGFTMPLWVLYAMSVFAIVVAAYLSYSALLTLGATVWLLPAIFAVVFVAYVLLRIAYLKRQGRDLMTELKAPPMPPSKSARPSAPPWTRASKKASYPYYPLYREHPGGSSAGVLSCISIQHAVFPI